MVPQLRTCGSPMPIGRLVEERVARRDAIVRGEPGVGRPAADAEAVVRFVDAVEPGHVADVDEELRRGETQLEQGQQAVAARTAPWRSPSLSLRILSASPTSAGRAYSNCPGIMVARTPPRSRWSSYDRRHSADVNGSTDPGVSSTATVSGHVHRLLR